MSNEQDCLTLEEADWNRKLRREAIEAQREYQSLQSQLKEAERRYVGAIKAEQLWLSHLARRYSLTENDRVTEDGQIVRD